MFPYLGYWYIYPTALLSPMTCRTIGIVLISLIALGQARKIVPDHNEHIFKVFPEPKLTCHWWVCLTFTCEQCHKKYSLTWSITYVWRLNFWNYYHIDEFMCHIINMTSVDCYICQNVDTWITWCNLEVLPRCIYRIQIWPLLYLQGSTLPIWIIFKPQHV